MKTLVDSTSKWSGVVHCVICVHQTLSFAESDPSATFESGNTCGTDFSVNVKRAGIARLRQNTTFCRLLPLGTRIAINNRVFEASFSSSHSTLRCHRAALRNQPTSRYKHFRLGRHLCRQLSVSLCKAYSRDAAPVEARRCQASTSLETADELTPD